MGVRLWEVFFYRILPALNESRLIEAKKAAGRAKDMNDLENLNID